MKRINERVIRGIADWMRPNNNRATYGMADRTSANETLIRFAGVADPDLDS